MNLLRSLESFDPASFGKVVLLYGGTSAEREISLKSGTAIGEALNALGVNTQLLDVGPDVAHQIAASDADFAFIALHGRGGEDGTIQGLLELSGIPYTGSGVLGSALAMQKEISKKVWRASGLPTADWRTLHASVDFQRILDDLGGRVMVKPASEGSSIGMSEASSLETLQAAWNDAKNYDSEVIAEAWIEGPEYTVPVIMGEALPVIQLKTEESFYTYNAKYISGATQYLCPAPVSDAIAEEMQSLAVRAFAALECRGWGRIDLMQDRAGNLQLLEANTVPGMTSHSLVPMAAAKLGLSFAQLVAAVLLSSRGAL